MSCPSFSGCARTRIEAGSFVGTAPDEEAYVILELPKPWPAKIKKMEGLVEKLRPILKKHQPYEARLLAAPEVDWLEPCDAPRAMLVRWTGRRAVYQTFPATPECLKAALVSPLPSQKFEAYLVCTHGSRDPCCGVLGIPVFKTLSAHGSRPVLQVSHLGGHRFAPVVGVFPEWKFYGRLEPEEFLLLDRALSNGEPYLKGYRGHGRLSGSLQVVEAQVWQESGQAPVRLSKVSGDKQDLTVEVGFADGQTRLYQAKLETLTYQGYKNCKDHRKGKESSLKLSVLKSLNAVAAKA